MEVIIKVSTKELYEKGLLEKAIKLIDYPYPSNGISDAEFLHLTDVQAALLDLIKIEATDHL